MERRKNVGHSARPQKDFNPDSRVSGPAGLTEFRRTLDLVEQHLLGPTGDVTPELSLSRAIDDAVGFHFIRDRRLYREHVLPYREQRAGYPDRQSFRSSGDGEPIRLHEELPGLETNPGVLVAGRFGTRRAG